MSSVNKCILVGNLGQDPDIRYTTDGRPIANLSVATSEKWKTRDGTPKENTTWHRVVIFSEGLAKIAQQYLRKGSKIYVEGALQTRSWEKDGQKHYTTEVVLSGFNSALKMLDGKPQGAPAQEREAGEQAALNAEAREAELSPFDDSSIPF